MERLPIGYDDLPERYPFEIRPAIVGGGAEVWFCVKRTTTMIEGHEWVAATFPDVRWEWNLAGTVSYEGRTRLVRRLAAGGRLLRRALAPARSGSLRGLLRGRN
jgi:hypothetical protein